MSDNNSFKCGKCGGSGKGAIDEQACGIFDCPYEPDGTNGPCIECALRHPSCPSCSKGHVQLAVECETCDVYAGVGKEPDCIACGSNAMFCRNDCKHWKPCPDCANGYRPLTDDEVRELTGMGTVKGDCLSLEQSNALITAMVFCAINEGLLIHKGSQVVLIPSTDATNC